MTSKQLLRELLPILMALSPLLVYLLPEASLPSQFFNPIVLAFLAALLYFAGDAVGERLVRRRGGNDS